MARLMSLSNLSLIINIVVLIGLITLFYGDLKERKLGMESMDDHNNYDIHNMERPNVRRLQSTKTTSSDTFHPLDPLSSNELLIGINIAKKYFNIDLKDHTTMIIYQWQYKFPPKSQVYDYLNSNKGRKSDFYRILDLDLSVLSISHKHGQIRTYFNIQIDTNTKDVIIVNKIDSNTGYPQVAPISDYIVVEPDVLFSDPEIYDYFTNKLGISPKYLSNVSCDFASPFTTYFVSILKEKVVNIQDIFNNYRLTTIGYCYLLIDMIEDTNPYQKHIPFLGLFNFDTNSMIYWWQCDDAEMNLDCNVITGYQQNEYLWSNNIGDTILTKEILKTEYDQNINDIGNICTQQRILNTPIIRPRISMQSENGPSWQIDGYNNDQDQDQYKDDGHDAYGDDEDDNNHFIKWQEWSFHQQFSQRDGVKLSDIRFNGRIIIYELKLSEIYVPYFDFNSLLWYSYGFLDIGHYGLGHYATTLNKTECPLESIYFKQDILNEDGTISKSPYYACLYERYTGNPRIRHAPHYAPNIELVYTSYWTVGNYDYIISYIFKLDGSIKISIGSSGFDLVSPINYKYTHDIYGSLNYNKYCNLLSDNFCGVFHDHIFNFRIDFDVDEINNNFYKGILKEQQQQQTDYGTQQKQQQSDGEPHKRHIWYYQEEKIYYEQNANDTMNAYSPKHWVFRSTSSKYFNSNVQYQTGYEVLPAPQSVLYWDSENDARETHLASWANKGIWVTKYNENELSSSGKYAWQAPLNKGIIEYVENNDYIENTDVVAWVSATFHHVTRSEDLPALPLHEIYIIIKPFNFFPYTPASCGDDIV